MSVSLPNGSAISIATTYGTAVSFTILTNANPAVATATGHGFADGDVLEVTSGWGGLTGQVVRVSGVTANTFNLEGVDTTDTIKFPAGAGIGSVREITGWAQILQIANTATSGGDMQFATISHLESDNEYQIPTQATPVKVDLTINDDPTLAGYIAVKAAAKTKKPYALRNLLPTGSVLYYNSYAALNEIPSMDKGAPMAVKASFSLISAPVRYAS